MSQKNKFDSMRESISNSREHGKSPVEGGQVIGWRDVNGMTVFTVASHSSITPDQEFVRYDDHLAAVASAADAPGIDIAPFRLLVEACEAEFTGTGTEETEPDESKVSYPEDQCHITFGMIRNARKTLDASPKGCGEVANLEKRANVAIQFLRNLVADNRDAVNPLMMSADGRKLHEAAECMAGLLDEVYRLRRDVHATPKGGSDWVATDADIAGWVARHDLAGAFGSKTDARCAFEDARSAEQAASAEVKS